MPAQVLPSEKLFDNFKKYMVAVGFREINPKEKLKNFERLGLVFPKKIKGQEVGFCFEANGLKVFVWTTFVAKEEKARDQDSGWVLITEGDKALYFSHPMRRTKYFLRRLYKHALIAKERVLNRPLCPECKGYMKIKKGKALKSRYWICKNHQKPIFQKWDYNLPEWILTFLKKERKLKTIYREKRKEVGKTTNQAMLKRKTAKITKPENMV